MFMQTVHQCHNQMSLKMGIEKCGDRAMEGIKKELQQLHMRDSFMPRLKKSLTAEECKHCVKQ